MIQIIEKVDHAHMEIMVQRKIKVTQTNYIINKWIRIYLK